MAAFFLDLDATLVEQRTNTLLPGALEMLKEMEVKGHQIVFTTRRGQDWENDHIYGTRSTQKFIDSLGIKYVAILFNIDSPRIVLNDGIGIGITHPKNAPLNYIIGDDNNPISQGDTETV